MRVFAQTRFLLLLNLMRLAIIAGLDPMVARGVSSARRGAGDGAGDSAFQGSGAGPDEETSGGRRGESVAVAQSWRLAGGGCVRGGGGGGSQVADPCFTSPLRSW